jgi:peptide/histidine transporter 3/4
MWVSQIFIFGVARQVARDGGFLDSPTKALPMTIFWLLPQYLLISLQEVFFTISTLDFYYTQFSPRLRALAHAMRLASMGIGLYWSTALTDAVVTITSHNRGKSWIVNNLNRCRLDKLYWLCAVIMAVNFFFFLVISSRYRYRVEDSIASSSQLHDDDDDLTQLENKTEIE